MGRMVHIDANPSKGLLGLSQANLRGGVPGPVLLVSDKFKT